MPHISAKNAGSASRRRKERTPRTSSAAAPMTANGTESGYIVQNWKGALCA